MNEALEKMSQRGVVTLQREHNAADLHVISLKCDSGQDASKRKREEADGDLTRLKGDSMRPSAMALRMKRQPLLSSLSDPTTQDIFALLQKPTARQRLLAEQVSIMRPNRGQYVKFWIDTIVRIST